MEISRRQLIGSGLSAGLFFNHQASASEPFKINTSEARDVEYKYQRREMAYETNEPPGTIIVDPVYRFLYFILGDGQARRYGVSVGKSTKAWKGEVVIKKMAPYHIQVKPELAKYLPNGMPGGLDNPLGARALYLFKGEVDTINRIHGSAKPGDIGLKHTAGCIGMLNVDIVHLYSTVQIGTRVIMLG
jgi:lipoprotein-anchoring transpeptidase ErfK/SrfK